MFERLHRIYLRVNMQTFAVVDRFELTCSILERPAEMAMTHFGKLEADEDVFVMVDTAWTHNQEARH
jgi:homoserine acetyltransferase